MTYTRWTWRNESDSELQDALFTSPDAAIKEMLARLGPPFTGIEGIMRLGFRLVLVRVTVEPIAELKPEVDAL